MEAEHIADLGRQITGMPRRTGSAWTRRGAATSARNGRPRSGREMIDPPGIHRGRQAQEVHGLESVPERTGEKG
jgi:hypothetical protein